MSIPLHENIPLLDLNYEGLKGHSFLCLMVKDVQITDEERKFRGWIQHMMVVSARKYNIARELVYKQNTTDQIKEGGLILYVFEVSEHLEHCISCLFKACMAIKNSRDKNEIYLDYFTKNESRIEKIAKIRNQFEHMYSQIVAGETGKGPLHISFSNEGKNVQFRKLKLETECLYILIRDLFYLVCDMYPGFDPKSKQTPEGPRKLILNAEVKFERNEQR